MTLSEDLFCEERGREGGGWKEREEDGQTDRGESQHLYIAIEALINYITIRDQFKKSKRTEK